jgi:prepilin peptidase CpaA
MRKSKKNINLLFLGLIIFLLPFILGGMGAGDVKLVAGIGAIKGAKFIFIDSLGIGVIGGIISLFIMLKHGKLKDLIDKFIYRIPLKNLLNRQENDSFGYSIPIVLGTWLLLLFR